MPFLTGSAPLPVEKLVRLRGEAGSIISKGLYAYHLREWLEYYDPLQLKVLLFEDFYKNVRIPLAEHLPVSIQTMHLSICSL